LAHCIGTHQLIREGLFAFALSLFTPSVATKRH
jgi:hypothetical protein